MEIPKNIKDEIWEYCRLNDITDLNAFMVKMLKQGYNIEKYGPTPFTVGGSTPEIIEKEVIKEVEKIVEKEVIKEVPVEVIKEVEKIVEKEVPVEVIKEKEVYITDDEEVIKLTKELESVKKNEKVHLSGLHEKVKELKEKDVKIETLNRKNSDLSSDILQLKEKIDSLIDELEIEKGKVEELSNTDGNVIKSLNQQIKNLKIELELEKNRHYERPKKERPKEDKPNRSGLGNVISWISKSERDDEKDLYGE